MNCLALYNWILGSKNDFLRPLQENDAWYQAGKKIWGQLEASSVLFILIFIIITAASVCLFLISVDGFFVDKLVQ